MYIHLTLNSQTGEMTIQLLNKYSVNKAVSQYIDRQFHGRNWVQSPVWRGRGGEERKRRKTRQSEGGRMKEGREEGKTERNEERVKI